MSAQKLEIIKKLLSEEKITDAPLNPELCYKIHSALELPQNLINHMLAVRDEALGICRALNENGLCLDTELIESAALIHDICRDEPKHPYAAAELLRKLGYFREARIIEQHHELKNEIIDEAAVVYLADKYIKEDKKVSLEERFSQSSKKCLSPEAENAHSRRYAQALKIEILIKNIIKTQLPL